MDGTWDLSLLYSGFDDENIEKDIAVLNALTDREEAIYKKEYASDAELTAALEEAADINEEKDALIEKLGSFASLTLATDATNADAQKLMDRIEMMGVRLSMVYSEGTRLIGHIDDPDKLIASSEKLSRIGFALKKRAEEAAHTPDANVQEWLLKMSLSGGSAFSTLRDKLDATHTVNYRGEELPLSAVRALAYDADPAVRKDAYEAELASYKKMEIPMAACLCGVKGEALTMIEAEHYDTVLDKTLDQSNMDRQTLDAMWTAIREYLPVFRKYLRKKGELLGYKNGLPFYELFAPVSMPGYTPRTYTVEQAKEKLVYELSKFSPDMGAFIAHAFDNRWIDMFPREGKGGGAFCSGLHGYDQSRVLTNFAGSFSDVSTLAHELGHAWHNRCMKGLPFAMCDEPMPLAETASIFNETLLADSVISAADDAEKLTLIENDLQNAAQTIVDIYSRFLFESNVIEERKTHNPSAEELCAMMLDAQEQSYGDGLSAEFRHPYMWACKSHYYYSGLSFYNFPYAFGQLFGMGVFALYKKEGPSFEKKYNQLLRSCGSMNVRDVAAGVGIDVSSADFWRSALDVYAGEIDEFIALADGMLK